MKLSNILNNVLVEEAGVVKNPKTGRNIKVSTALGYGPSHPAYKLAKKQAGDTDGGEAQSGEFDTSGETDYFEKYEELPDNISKLNKKYFWDSDEYEYSELEDILSKFEKEGWTFDYDLDGSPYGLRPLDKSSTPDEESKPTPSDSEFEYDEFDNSLTFGDGEKVKVDYDGDFQYKGEWFNINDYEDEDELKLAISNTISSKNENTTMKISKNMLRKLVNEVITEEEEYKKFFKKALEKTGKSISSMSDAEKKKFFNKIDAHWKSKAEKAEGNEFGAQRARAIAKGEDEFSVDGKSFPVTDVDDEDRENAKAFVGESFDFNRFRKLAGILPKESINEGKHDAMLDKLANIVKGVSFVNVGRELKKNGIKYSFSTSMIPMYKIDKLPIAIVNKKYAAGAEREVGDIAIGLLESVNENYKSIMSDRGKNLFFTIVDDKTDRVETIDLKKWLKASPKDKSSDYYKELVINTILRNQKQFNKKVDYNMWQKKNKPSFEEKMEYFMKNGFINNITKRGIKVYEGVESVVSEGRGFVAAAKRAKDAGKTEFEYKGKKYPVTLKESSKLKNILRNK